MTQPKSTDTATLPDSLKPVAEQLRARFQNSRQALNSQIIRVTSCKSSHREHTVRGIGRRPVEQMLKDKDKLPKTLWMSTVGTFLIDTLEQIITLDQDIHAAHNAIAIREADLLLLHHLDPGDEPENSADNFSARLENQLLTEWAAQAISQLQELLRDCDSAVAPEREALSYALVGFIEKHMEIALTEAGWHTVPNLREMPAWEMISKSQQLIREIQTTLSEPRVKQFGLSRADSALISLNLNRAITLALLSFPRFAETRAKHVCGSTVDGRMTFLRNCVAALEPAPAVEGTPADKVAYRIKCSFERMGKTVDEHIVQFRRTLERSTVDLERAAQVVSEAIQLKLDLSQIRTR